MSWRNRTDRRPSSENNENTDSATAALREMFETYRHTQESGTEVSMSVATGRDNIPRPPSADAALDALFAEAANEALVHSLSRERIKADKITKDKKRSSLKSAKEKMAKAQKPRMRTVEQYLCDECDRIIPCNKAGVEGFVIRGNIYVADPNRRLGLIGDNIPEPKADEKIDPQAIHETVLCKQCFLKALLPCDTAAAPGSILDALARESKSRCMGNASWRP